MKAHFALRIIGFSFCAALAFGVLLGCSKTNVKDTDITFTFMDNATGEQTSHKLNADGVEYLETLLQREPDVEIPTQLDHLTAEWVVIDGQKYSVRTDRLFLISEKGNKIWDQPGIRNQLIKQSTKIPN